MRRKPSAPSIARRKALDEDARLGEARRSRDKGEQGRHWHVQTHLIAEYEDDARGRDERTDEAGRAKALDPLDDREGKGQQRNERGDHRSGSSRRLAKPGVEEYVRQAEVEEPDEHDAGEILASRHRPMERDDEGRKQHRRDAEAKCRAPEGRHLPEADAHRDRVGPADQYRGRERHHRGSAGRTGCRHGEPTRPA